MSWVPPGGGGPVGSPPAPEPVPESTVPAAPVPAAPVPAAPAAVAPAVAGSTTPSNAIPIIVAVIGSLVAGSLIGGIGTGISMANAPSYPSYPDYPYPTEEPVTGDYSDLAEGEPGPTTAVTPTTCDTLCYDEATVAEVTLEDSVFASWYLPEWSGLATATTADAAFVDERDQWESTGYSPDECFVTFSELPITEPDGSAPDHDPLIPVTAHSSSANPSTELQQWVRLFPDSASAEAYMQTLDAGLDACTRYHDPNGYAIDAITLEPYMHQPDTVAAAGFVRSLGGIRYYVMDLQRGNMVIRSFAYSDGGITDDRFRPLMQEQAALLGDLPELPLVE